MSFLFKEFISDEVVEKHFQERYGKDYELHIDVQYQFEHRKKKMDIGFTRDAKAFWIFQYKKEYYMNIMDDIELNDKYTVIDIYTTLEENAKKSYDSIVGLQKMRKEAKNEI